MKHKKSTFENWKNRNELLNICTGEVNIWTFKHLNIRNEYLKWTFEHLHIESEHLNIEKSLVKDLSGLTCTAKPLSNSQGDKDYKKWINQGFMYVYDDDEENKEVWEEKLQYK